MSLPISVIIPCWQQERFLSKAVESALSADAAEVRVFIDSPDKAAGYELCKAFDTPRVTVTGKDFQFRTGVCFARNYLIARAKNDLLLCLDADDRLYPDALKRLQISYLKGVWVYPGAYNEIDENEQVIATCETPPSKMIFRKNLCYSTFMFNRTDWLKTGGYDPSFEHFDEDYAYQCALVHHSVKAVQVFPLHPMYERMIHENSRTSQARPHWNTTLALCKQKYPGAFQQ